MIIQSEHLHVELTHGLTFELSEARGTELTCLAGAIWVTQHHHCTDWVLKSGQFLTIDNTGKTVISACHEDAIFSAQRRAHQQVKSGIDQTLNVRGYSPFGSSGAAA